MNAHSISSRPISPAERPQPRDQAAEGAKASDLAETPPENAFTSLVEAQNSDRPMAEAGRGERAQEPSDLDETQQEQAGDPLAATPDASLPAHPSLRPDLAWLAASQIQSQSGDPALAPVTPPSMAMVGAEQGDRISLALTALKPGPDEGGVLTQQAALQGTPEATQHAASQGTMQAAQAQGSQPYDRVQAHGATPDAFQNFVAETEATPNLDLLNAPASPSGTALPARMAEMIQTQQQPNLPTPTMPVPIMALPAAIGIKALEGAHIFDIRLDPDDLGRVDIVLEIDQEGGIRAAIAAEKPEALQLIMREARALEQAFDQAGFRRDENALSFSLADREPSSQHSHHPSEKPAITRLMTEGEGDLPAQLETLLAHANGRLDVRI